MPGFGETLFGCWDDDCVFGSEGLVVIEIFRTSLSPSFTRTVTELSPPLAIVYARLPSVICAVRRNLPPEATVSVNCAIPIHF